MPDTNNRHVSMYVPSELDEEWRALSAVLRGVGDSQSKFLFRSAMATALERGLVRPTPALTRYLSHWAPGSAA